MSKKMAAREYLGQAYWLDQRINSKISQALLLRNSAMNISANLKEICVQTSRVNSNTEETLVKIYDQEKEICKQIGELIDLKQEIRQAIEAVPSIEHRLLLELRYLCFRSWEEIAIEMNYSIDYTYKVHRKALEMVIVPV